MAGTRKYGLRNLARKTLAVASASMALLNASNSYAMPVSQSITQNDDHFRSAPNSKMTKPKLLLKLSPNGPEHSQLAYHRSHSSHSSHSSHRSHSSHYSGGASISSSGGGGDGGSGGNIVLGLAVTGLVGFGAYQLGKMNKGNNNK